MQNRDLDAASFQERMRAGDAQLIDVRTPAEFKSGHLAGAANLDWNGGGP
ncbi:MAG: rhodanese-like domain-containing protein [Flavobacteriales bacterium]|nr:rhodanese-like domain-containing protein [Flavobacteriales bacterium]